MGEIDHEEKQNCLSVDEEELFLSMVICGDAELLYLDTYLRETLGKRL